VSMAVQTRPSSVNSALDRQRGWWRAVAGSLLHGVRTPDQAPLVGW